MTKKGSFFRFDPEMLEKITAWSLVKRIGKTSIIEEAFKLWESNQSEAERKKADSIIEGLQ